LEVLPAVKIGLDAAVDTEVEPIVEAEEMLEAAEVDTCCN
jgi:hypothetical protein